MKLENLEKYDKETCLDILQKADLAALWDQFLKTQSALFFDQETNVIADEPWWIKAENILEMGSGNGVYLHKLLKKFGDKSYVGVEKQPQLVEQSKKIFNTSKLEFLEGDAEIEDRKFLGQFDVILFRLTLQHLNAPWLALEHAYKYLKQGGRIFIIDAYDPVRSSSCKLSSLEEASRKHNELNKKNARGNRLVTMEILNALYNSEGPLKGMYEVEFTNLDTKGELLKKVVVFEGESDRKLYFNQVLLYLAILDKSWQIPVDFSKAYDELKIYLEDKDAWIHPGTHYLVLRKTDLNRVQLEALSASAGDQLTLEKVAPPNFSKERIHTMSETDYDFDTLDTTPKPPVLFSNTLVHEISSDEESSGQENRGRMKI